MTKTKSGRILVAILIDKDVYEDAKTLAASQDRKFSEFIRHLLRLALEKK